MVKAFLAAGAAAAAFVGAQASAATYNVTAQVGANTVAGTIETNGTIGALSQNDVTGYFLTFTRDGNVTGVADFNDVVQFEIGGNALTATASALSFDYSSDTLGSGFYFADSTFSNYFCSNANSGFGCGNGLRNSLTIAAGGANLAVTRSGVQLIGISDATAGVPEPAVWALMIGGFGMVGSSFRRRKVAMKIAFA